MTFIHESVVLNVLELLAVAAMGLGIAWGTLLVTRLFRRRSAPFREMILKGGTCLLLGWPVVVLIGVVIGSVTRPVPQVVRVDAVSEVTLTPSPSPGGRGEQIQTVATGRKRETVGTVWTPAAEFVASAEKTIQDMLTEPSPEPGMSYTMLTLPRLVEVAIVTWGLGLVVSLGFLLRDLIRVRRVRQRFVPCSQEIAISALQQVSQSIGLKRTPDLLLSPDLTSPCTAGVRRPAIVLPTGMLDTTPDRESLLGVLTHEAAHVKRRDVAWSLLVRCVRAVYWWEFGLAIIDRQLSQLREEICDNYVLLAPVDRRVYAKTLLDFAEGWVMRPLVGVIGMMGKNNPLSNRIERMLAENTQPHTRTSGWSRTGLICGGLVAVATVGLLGVWAERAGAVDPLIVRANLQSRNLSSSTEAHPWSGQSEVTPVPAWSGSSSVPRDPSIERSNVTSRPGRTRADSSIPGMAQVRSGGNKPAPPIPFEPELSATDEPKDFPLRSAPEPEMAPVIQMRTVSQRRPDGTSEEVQVPYVVMMPKEEARLYELSQKSEQNATLEVQVTGDQTWTNGQDVSLSLSVPESQQVQLPKQIIVHGVQVTEPNSLEAPPLLPEVDQFKDLAPAPTDLDKTDTPPAPPTAEPATASASRKVTLTGPWQAVVTAKWMIELGGVPTLTASSTPETKSEIPAGVIPQGPRYRLVCEAKSDETGQLKGIMCFGRDIPIGETGPVESFKSFAAAWKQQCQSIPQAVPNYEPIPSRPVPSFPSDSRPVPSHRSELKTRAVNPELLIVINVPDTMRYGEVQKIAMACDSDAVHVEVRSGSSPSVSAPHWKSYTSVELTRVYDKQGKPVGPGAILVAHKFGVTDPQIITDTHWNRALGDFARRHASGTNVLLVNADADVSLDVLRDLQIRANREGFEEVQFLTAAVPATLEIRSSDGLFPLLDDLPSPNPPPSEGEIFQSDDVPTSRNRGLETPPEDLPGKEV
jgi:beta-lactamase regulating signal transducer with metallopeptidase domain